MRNLLMISFFLLSSIGFSSFISSEFNPDNKIVSQEYELMIGEFNIKDLKATKNKTWFDSSYKAYTPKADVIKKINSLINENEYYITIYMGTWCADSRRELPHLIKILKQANFNFNNLSIVGVDQDKVVQNITKKKREQLNIINVPTIIIYNNKGKEINRFIEFAQESLEEDLEKIFSNQDYKNVYDF